MQLSKSEYMIFLKHPAWVWLKKHKKSALPPPDAALQALFDSGHAFEAYAEQRFPDAVKLGFDNYNEYLTLPERTQKAIADGAETIFQGRFEANDTTCIIDVLQKVGDKLFDLFEIKASTSVKTDHIPDLAFQCNVLEGAGLKIRNTGVIHVNRAYVRQGEIDIDALSKVSDVTEAVSDRRSQTAAETEQALKAIQAPDMPDLSPRNADQSDLQEWLEIFEILKGAFEPRSIYKLPGLRPDQVAFLEDRNIAEIKDIPDEMRMSVRQAGFVELVQQRKRHIDENQIRSFLNELTFPLYFLDYETFSNAVPAFDGVRPYQQVPFQYSLHVFSAPDAELEHRGYLHADPSLPVPALAEQLQKDIGETGSVIVWYAPFEMGRNGEMGRMLPEHKDFFEQLNARVVDLMEPFKKGWFTDAAFLGSASIKNVLPVLVPELGYKDLQIQDGGMAQRAWMKRYIEGDNSGSEEQLLQSLNAYCALDTLAMVRIHEVLRNI